VLTSQWTNTDGREFSALLFEICETFYSSSEECSAAADDEEEAEAEEAAGDEEDSASGREPCAD